MKMSIFEFCEYYHACSEGRKWARAHCKTMKEVWDKAPLEYLIWVARRSLTYRQKEELFFLLNEHYFCTDPPDKIWELNFSLWCHKQTKSYTDEEVMTTISMYIRTFTPNFTREFHVR